ncbi:MAG: hypothetical protein IIW13_02335 [Paludibacteraceae bacterium]|nr:hypothetical protein [Paludibacteraceae bacterium]
MNENQHILWGRVFGALLFVVLVVALSVAIVRSCKKSDLRKHSNVRVEIVDGEENYFVTESDVLGILQKKGFLKQDSLIIKDLTKIENVLSKEKSIRKVECFFVTNGDVTVRIWQRTPIFRVYGEQNFYVDKDGKNFPLSEHSVAHVPIVTGSIDSLFVSTIFSEMMTFIASDEFWSAQVQQIHISENQELTMIPRLGDHKIFLGKIVDYPIKLKKMKKFYKNGLTKIGWGDYSIIDVSYANQVICKRKNNK